MPNALYWLALAEGQAASLSGVDLRVARLYFAWDVFNVRAGLGLGLGVGLGFRVRVRGRGRVALTPTPPPPWGGGGGRSG